MSLPAFTYNPPKQEIEILHRDDDLLIVSKPAGLLSVPGKPADHHDCLESRIRAQIPDARIVHRLDMATSGIMVLAMNAKAHRHLGLQFERRHIEKTYVAKVRGQVEEDEGIIELPLRCDWPNRPLQMVDHQLGKSALTKWQVLERSQNSTRLLLTPKTGRSHQLRVHMLSIGHPILGDEFYADDKAKAAADRLMLHAQSLELFHPTGGKTHKFSDPPPF
ncbi:MAG: RluA family pseudouridine synthase [Rhizobiaceae bacterium]|nr:RluA family pseudouridine synthase [Rhizobiaceae bacterium]